MDQRTRPSRWISKSWQPSRLSASPPPSYHLRPAQLMLSFSELSQAPDARNIAKVRQERVNCTPKSLSPASRENGVVSQSHLSTCQLVNKDITFYDASLCLVDFRSAPYRANYVVVRFRFDKGGGQNFSSRKFKKMPSDAFLCPVLTAHRILVRWLHLGADEVFPICCHFGSSGIKVLGDKTVTDTIRLAVKKAYPAPNHMFRREISLSRTHLRVLHPHCSRSQQRTDRVQAPLVLIGLERLH